MAVRVTKPIQAAAAGLCILCAPALAHAQTQSQPDHGTFIFNNRLRSETVDQDGFGSNADALTLRTQLGWQSAQAGSFRFLIEGEATYAFIADYNSTVNGKTTYPTVADPQSSELNRLQVTWTGLPKTQVVAGRQTLVLDNARFVGDSGFRQTEQTFDGVRFTTTAIAPVTLTYAYIGRVNRVFGNKSVQGHWDGNVNVLNVAAKTPIGAFSAYDYMLDFDNAKTQSSATIGARLTGEHPTGGAVAVTYGAEWARQTDYGSNPANFSVDYNSLSVGLKTAALAVSLNREQLGSDGSFAFQTPLATLHPFQGWADVFLTTPAAGLTDTFVSASCTQTFTGFIKSMKATLAYHDFRSVRGQLRFGSEWDAGVMIPLNKKWAATAQIASFSGETPSMKDRTKLWLALDYSY